MVYQGHVDPAIRSSGDWQDQDFDGSHIKGLVINFIQYFWPSLLKLDFLQQFITPIVKATKGKKSTMFFTMEQYKTWLQSHNQGKGYYIK